MRGRTALARLPDARLERRWLRARAAAQGPRDDRAQLAASLVARRARVGARADRVGVRGRAHATRDDRAGGRRSEEHTSELQSQSNLVCRLLLEKKKNKNYTR